MKHPNQYFHQVEVQPVYLHTLKPADASIPQIVEKRMRVIQPRNALHALLLDSRLLTLALALALTVLVLEIYTLVVHGWDILMNEQYLLGIDIFLLTWGLASLVAIQIQIRDARREQGFWNRLVGEHGSLV
jgi:hypothetical protein